MRKARNKIRKAFAENRPGSDEFARLVEEFSQEIEVIAAYQEEMEGRDFFNNDPETKRELINTLLS